MQDQLMPSAPEQPPTREEAMASFKTLVGQYGLQWTATVPAIAWAQLARANAVLTTADRRAALGLPQ